MVWTGLDWTGLSWAGLGWAGLSWDGDGNGMDSSCDIERTRERERERKKKKILSNFFHSEHPCVTLVISLSHSRICFCFHVLFCSVLSIFSSCLHVMLCQKKITLVVGRSSQVCLSVSLSVYILSHLPIHLPSQ